MNVRRAERVTSVLLGLFTLGAFLGLLWFLLGCRSPDEVTVGTGYAWRNVEDAPAWDHEGPDVAAGVTWRLGTAHEADLAEIDQRRILRQWSKQEGVEMPQTEPEVETTPNQGTLVEVKEALLDTSEGPLGLPVGLWVAMILVIVVLGAVVPLKRLGVWPFGKKKDGKLP